MPIIKAVQRLSEKGVLPENLVTQINESRIVRNEAVHNTGEVDVQRVKKAADIFLEISTKVIGFI